MFPLDEMFDFNGDGRLDAFEQGAEFAILDEMAVEEQADDEDCETIGGREGGF